MTHPATTHPGHDRCFDTGAALDALDAALRARPQRRRGRPRVEHCTAGARPLLHDCLTRMGVPPVVAARVSADDLRAFYAGLQVPFELTLGAAVVLYTSQRAAALKVPPEQILDQAHRVARRVAQVTPDRTFGDMVRAARAPGGPR